MAVRLIAAGNNFIDLTNICQGDISLKTSVKKTPSVLSFRILFDESTKDKISVEEGTQVMLYSEEEGIFNGYVFRRELSDGEFLEITAYDQLRYFNNRDSFYFKDMRASEIIKNVCTMFKVDAGEISQTNYTIPLLVCNNTTIWDVFEKALELEESFTNEKYVIYDDFGRVVMKNIKNMTAPAIISEEDKSIISLRLRSDIDENTFNKIKLLKRNKEEEAYMTAAVQEGDSVEKWGVLQYSEIIEDEINSAMANNLAEKLLKEKNRAFLSLNITEMGNINLRAGNSVRVKLQGFEEKLFYVKECIHTFRNEEHIMKAELTDYE